MKVRPSITYLFISFMAIVISCTNSASRKETILEGHVTLLVDETLEPIISDQVQIFENRYRAKISIEAKSENEVIQELAKDTGRIAILTRTLNKEERALFQRRKIIPRITKFATDGIALITNIKDRDSLITSEDIVRFLQTKPSKIKGLVFDNINSSTARYLADFAQIKQLPKDGIYSFHTNEEAIKYVSENEGMIGVVGINWIVEPTAAVQQYLPNIRVLSVKNREGQYKLPSQNDIAEKKYPLARDLFLVNCQGYSGLGMGFASFLAGETGQRIILKSGLVPAKAPSRRLQIRNSIEKKPNN